MKFGSYQHTCTSPGHEVTESLSTRSLTDDSNSLRTLTQN